MLDWDGGLSSQSTELSSQSWVTAFQASDGQPASDGQVHTLAGVPGRTGVCWYKRTAKTTEWLWHVPRLASLGRQSVCLRYVPEGGRVCLCLSRKEAEEAMCEPTAASIEGGALPPLDRLFEMNQSHGKTETAKPNTLSSPLLVPSRQLHRANVSGSAYFSYPGRSFRPRVLRTCLQIVIL